MRATSGLVAVSRLSKDRPARIGIFIKSKVFRADDSEPGRRHRCGVRHGLPFMPKAGQGVEIARERQPHRHRRRFNARLGLEPREQRRHEGSRARGIGIPRDRQRQTERRDAFGIEARLDAVELNVAADQQARCHQQHRRTGKLRDDKDASSARSARADRTVTSQRDSPVSRPSRYRQGRRQPGHDARDECQRQAEAKDVHIDRELLQSRDRRRPEQHQCTHNPECQTCTGRRAEYPEHQTLDQQLSDELAPARAQRRSHGQFTATRLSTCEQQIRDVGAGDQKHQRHRAENGHQDGADVANNPLVQRHGRHRRVFFCLRKLGRQAVGHCLQRDGRLAGRDRRLQARQHLQPLCAARAGREITRLEDERPPEFRSGREPQTGRSDSDNRHRLAIERRRRADDVGTSPEPTSPQAIGDDDLIAITLPVGFPRTSDREPSAHPGG